MARSKKRRRYSDEDRAEALAALAANGGNLRRTAAQLGIPRGTLKRWAEGTAHPEAGAVAPQKKEALADRLEALAHRLADVLPDRLDAASLPQVATALGILVDKMQLLRGDPTSIDRHELTDLTDDELDRRLAETERALAAAARGEAPPAGG